MGNVKQISRPKGTKDIYGEDIKIWQKIEEKIRKITKNRNVSEIRTPVFEDTNLFCRGVGDETDIVNKEMYTFLDKGGRSITLRPELTACAVRSYTENGFASLPSPCKMWYIGNMYRYEKMQKGRFREFSQFGVEFFGSENVLADVEVISLAYDVFKELDLLDVITLKINSIGCKECRAKYVQAIKDYLKDEINNMCEDCQKRYIKNPMRIIDCKEEYCKNVNKGLPMITDYLCEDCSKDFEILKGILNNAGIKYEVDKTIVRGLDYYNKTVFEFESKDLNLAVGGGGRYDTLVETLGGPKTPAVGFALGMDRIVILLKELKDIKIENNVEVYFMTLNNEAYGKSLSIVNRMRDEVVCDIDVSGRSFNSQMKYANKLGAKYVVIIGEDELGSGNCIVKNMINSEQVTVKLDEKEILNYMKGNE